MSLRFYPGLPIQLAIFFFSQENGLVVLLRLAKGNVPAAVQAFQGFLLQTDGFTR